MCSVMGGRFAGGGGAADGGGRAWMEGRHQVQRP